MLTEDGCRQRQRNLWATLPESVDWVLVADSRHVQYFCGFRVNPMSFSADQRAALLLHRDGRSVLVADNFTRRTAAADVFVNDEVIAPWYDHKHSVGNRDHALRDALASQAATLGARRGLVETEAASIDLVSALPVDSARGAQELSLGTVIRELRRSKLPDELELLQCCMDAGAAGQDAAFDAVQAGATELDVFLRVEEAAQQSAGCACIIYGDFRATNAKVFKAGGLPTQYELKDGDLFLLDYSVVIGGYRSDFTNTIAVGQPTPQQGTQAEACLAAVEAAAAALGPDADCSEIFRIASNVLSEHGFPGLPHHAGHGLGMEHPEPPILVLESTDRLRVGDVVTIEPGLYVEGTGGMRFEHNYVITDEGSTPLSHHELGLTRQASRPG